MDGGLLLRRHVRRRRGDGQLRRVQRVGAHAVRALRPRRAHLLLVPQVQVQARPILRRRGRGRRAPRRVAHPPPAPAVPPLGRGPAPFPRPRPRAPRRGRRRPVPRRSGLLRCAVALHRIRAQEVRLPLLRIPIRGPTTRTTAPMLCLPWPERSMGRAEAVPIVGAEPNEKHYIRSLSCRGKKSDGGQHTVPPLTDAKKREPDTWEDGCQQREGRAMPDAVPGDHYAKTNMVSSDLQAIYTKKKMEESLERSGEKKCPEEIPGMLNQDEQRESLKLEASGIRMISSVAEQELHSEFVGSEISMYKQQAEGNHNAGLKSGTMNSVIKMHDGKLSKEDVTVHEGPNKMHDLWGLQKLSNQTSNLQDVASVPNLQIVQSKSHIIKLEPGPQENEIADAVQLVSDGHKSDKQVLGDTAGFSTVQKNASKLTYASACCEHPKCETENPMHAVAAHPNSLSGVAKICKSFSGSISILCELTHSLVSKEPSSARNTDCLTKKELVSPTDSKHDSAKFSEESSQELTRCSEKVQLKGSLPSAPKSSQASKTYVSTVKPRLPVSKEQSQKTATTGSASARSLHGEVPPLQSRNKAVPSNSSQRKDKVHQRTIHVTREGSNNSTST